MVRATVLFVLIAGIPATLAGCGSGAVPGLPPTPLYVVSGTVSGEDGRPWRHASVNLEGTPLGAVTDDEGRFGIDGIRPGTYRLTVLHLGYRSAGQWVVVPDQPAATLTLGMTPAPEFAPVIADSTGPAVLAFEIEPAG